ncbi:hypothetical protein LguiB_017076 [Lonicera macranthoides]
MESGGASGDGRSDQSPPNPREVRIRIICTSLCFTDIAFWKMKVHYRFWSSLFPPLHFVFLLLALNLNAGHYFCVISFT